MLVAVGNRLGRTQIGFGAGERCFIDRRVDLIELLAGLDVAAFLEQALENDAVDLRTHLGNAERRGTARQFAVQHHSLGLQGDHADFGNVVLLRRLGLLASGKGRQGDQQGR
ncbi:hypothetical protein D9M73_230720 [compost metagenome]